MRFRVMVYAGLLLCGAAALWSQAGAAANDPCGRASQLLSRHGLHLVYLKEEHMLCLQDGTSTTWFSAASHGRKAGKKRFERDERTPEGAYTVSPARPSRRFGTFLPISYPSAQDVRHARAQGQQPGGAIGIHGPQDWYAFLGSWQAAIDHSDGCIVVDRQAIAELAARVRRPIPIDLFP